jgi:hypothetical protein
MSYQQLVSHDQRHPSPHFSIERVKRFEVLKPYILMIIGQSLNESILFTYQEMKQRLVPQNVSVLKLYSHN